MDIEQYLRTYCQKELCYKYFESNNTLKEIINNLYTCCFRFNLTNNQTIYMLNKFIEPFLDTNFISNEKLKKENNKLKEKNELLNHKLVSAYKEIKKLNLDELIDLGIEDDKDTSIDYFTLTEISKILGVSRKAIYDFQKKHNKSKEYPGN